MDIIILFYVLVIIYKLLFYIIEKQFQTKESKNKNKNIIINFEMAFSRKPIHGIKWLKKDTVEMLIDKIKKKTNNENKKVRLFIGHGGKQIFSNRCKPLYKLLRKSLKKNNNKITIVILVKNYTIHDKYNIDNIRKYLYDTDYFYKRTMFLHKTPKKNKRVKYRNIIENYLKKYNLRCQVCNGCGILICPRTSLRRIKYGQLPEKCYNCFNTLEQYEC